MKRFYCQPTCTWHNATAKERRDTTESVCWLSSRKWYLTAPGRKAQGTRTKPQSSLQKTKTSVCGCRLLEKALDRQTARVRKKRTMVRDERGQNAEEVTFTTHISFSLRCGNDKWTRFGSVFITHSVGIPTAANLVSMVLCVCSLSLFPCSSEHLMGAFICLCTTHKYNYLLLHAGLMLHKWLAVLFMSVIFNFISIASCKDIIVVTLISATRYIVHFYTLYYLFELYTYLCYIFHNLCDNQIIGIYIVRVIRNAYNTQIINKWLFIISCRLLKSIALLWTTTKHTRTPKSTK